MAPLTLADTHNMVAFLSKSDASARFDQIVNFLNAQVIHYALMVNTTIYVFCIKKFWATASIKKVNDVVKLQALIDRKKVAAAEEEDEDDEVPVAPTPPSLTHKPSPPPHEPITTPLQAQPTPPSSSPQKQPTTTSASDMTLLITLMETCTTLSHKVAALEQDKVAQALEIFKLKRRVKKLEKKSGSKSLGLKRLRKVVLINNQVDDLSSHTTKYTSLVLTQKVFANMRRIGKGFFGVETPLFATMLVQPQVAAEEEDDKDEGCCIGTRQKCSSVRDYQAQEEGKEIREEEEIKSFWFKEGRIERKDDDNVAAKEVNAAEPTMFDDEEVTMTMAQILIKMKAKKARILDEQMAKRLHDEEVKKAATREKKEKDDFKRAHECKRSILVRPIFKREYYKVQTFLKPDRDEEPTKKRVAKKTLLQESFKKLRAEVKVSVSEFKVEALQVKEDLDALWRLVKEKFSIAVPRVDNKKALWVELKRLFEADADDVIRKLQRYMHYPIMWKFHSNCGVHQVSSKTRRHDIYVLAEKDYPVSNEVMSLMLSTKLQVEEDSEVARDLVMKIFMKANQP
nr:hypothetical protein [Tanacetum cinerariifolium]